ncbi:hypothetical protein INR49_017177 [Caranx melampygus]|nr:hypothetical protein INR49_017177 [Caranx melampygus]
MHRGQSSKAKVANQRRDSPHEDTRGERCVLSVSEPRSTLLLLPLLLSAGLTGWRSSPVQPLHQLLQGRFGLWKFFDSSHNHTGEGGGGGGVIDWVTVVTDLHVLVSTDRFLNTLQSGCVGFPRGSAVSAMSDFSAQTAKLSPDCGWRKKL